MTPTKLTLTLLVVLQILIAVGLYFATQNLKKELECRKEQGYWVKNYCIKK